ncbi:MAG: HAD family hydrolase [Propionicimonas sp.]
MSANETLMRVCDAALFDLDGVLTPTAEVHMRAWSRMFNDFLDARRPSTLRQAQGRPSSGSGGGGSGSGGGGGEDLRAYTEADYFEHVDGKPRYDGVRDFLASRAIMLPLGEPSDPPEAETVCGLGNRKNLSFAAVLETEGVRPYPGSVLLLDYLAATGVAVAVVSSSKNADAVLTAAGLRDRFEVVVDGNLATDLGLPGKPAPDTYSHAAAALGVPVERAVVFEDAVSGTASGRAGHFGLVVGVDRGVGAQALLDSGADLVVSDLAELLP